MLRTVTGAYPDVAGSAFVSERAYIVGDVRVGSHASTWPFVCLRGDCPRVPTDGRTRGESSFSTPDNRGGVNGN